MVTITAHGSPHFLNNLIIIVYVRHHAKDIGFEMFWSEMEYIFYERVRPQPRPEFLLVFSRNRSAFVELGVSGKKARHCFGQDRVNLENLVNFANDCILVEKISTFPSI